jgi:hypothetical protein
MEPPEKPVFAEEIDKLFKKPGHKNSHLSPDVSSSLIQKIRKQNYLPSEREVGAIATAMNKYGIPVDYEHLMGLWRQQKAASAAIQEKFPSSSDIDQILALKDDKSLSAQNPDLPADVVDLVVQKTRDFVGRGYIFDAIDSFLKSRPNGYFHIRGDPGQGKTAILAELVRRRACPAHFNIRAERRAGTAHFLKSLQSQLPASRTLMVDNLSSAADLSQILHAAAAGLRPTEQLLLVVDALDEVDPSARNAGENILCLPSNLPDRIFFVLSSRRGATVPLQAASIQQLDLSDFSKESFEDIKQYVERATHRPAIQKWLRSIKFRPNSFVEALAEKSQCNFMYVYYVLHDVEAGQYTDRTFLTLPTGLENYYQMHWERMGMMRQPVDRGRLILLYTLSQIRMPVSRALLAQFAMLDEMTVQHILDEWSQFLHRQPVDGEPRWSIYHGSFSDFLERADIIQAAGVSLPDINQTISDQLLKEIHGSDPS